MHILMVDHNGMCNEDGNEIGHSSKVLGEYAALIQSLGNIDAAIPKCICKNVDFKYINIVHELPYNIFLENNQGIFKRIADKVKIFRNIHCVMKLTKYDLVWFYKVDFFLAIYMLMTKRIKRESRIIGLIYQQSLDTPFSSLINYLYKKGLNCFDGIIDTQKKATLQHTNQLYMPDYYYIPELYDKYQSMNKMAKVVCVGTMNYYKELEQLVECFNKLHYPLEVRGCFTDKRMFQRLKSMAEKNVIICDEILSVDAYYSLIGESQYTILPYNMQQYKERTSGVLYETIFLKSIPIAPSLLLEYNELEGIGYESWEQLLNLLPLYFDSKQLFQNKEQNDTIYTFDILKERLCDFLRRIANA